MLQPSTQLLTRSHPAACRLPSEILGNKLGLHILTLAPFPPKSQSKEMWKSRSIAGATIRDWARLLGLLSEVCACKIYLNRTEGYWMFLQSIHFVCNSTHFCHIKGGENLLNNLSLMGFIAQRGTVIIIFCSLSRSSVFVSPYRPVCSLSSLAREGLPARRFQHVSGVLALAVHAEAVVMLWTRDVDPSCAFFQFICVLCEHRWRDH